MRTVITPSKARLLLEANTINRKVNKSAVEFLIKAITDGKWVYNGESIIIAKDGTLLDGQHRLIACVKSGISIDVELVENVDKTVMPTIDTGNARTAGNVLSIEGIKNANVIASACRGILDLIRTQRETGKNATYIKRSNLEILNYYNSKKEIIRPLVDLMMHLYGNGAKIISSSKAVSIAYLFLYESDTKTVIDFFREIFLGVRLRESTAAQLFRNKLINEKMSQNKMSDRIKLDFMIKAFRLYKDNESKKIYVKNTMYFEKNDVNFAPYCDIDYINKIKG